MTIRYKDATDLLGSLHHWHDQAEQEGDSGGGGGGGERGESISFPPTASGPN